MFITEPLFYFVAIPAVIIYGISKGGFGGGLGVLAVPLMTLVVSPVQAAAIMLPVLCFMDLFGLWAFKGKWDPVNLKTLIPGALIGLLLGTLLFKYMNGGMIKLILGVVSILFTLDYWTKQWRKLEQLSRKPSYLWGTIAGVVGGFTSFIAHSGAPPVSMYLLPQKMNRTIFVATTILFFTVMNYVKLVPYAWLGLLQTDNLATGLLLLPTAAVGVLSGVWLHNRVSDKVFYHLCYGLLFFIGGKLIYDGLVF